MKYDYREVITKAIKDWIIDNDVLEEAKKEEWSYDDLCEWLYDELFNEDEITGNGIYYYDTEEKCSEYLSGNFDLLYEAAHETCIDDEINVLIQHYEQKDLARYFDCTIRCYLLGECIDRVVNELKFDNK